MIVYQSNHRVIVRETILSALINAAISAFMAWLLFGGSKLIERSDVLVDFVPQTFMVALMGSLVPAAIARRKVRQATAGDLRRPPARRAPNLLVHSLLVALPATLVLGGGAALLTAIFLDPEIGLKTLMIIKPIYGAFVALIVTPFALQRVLSKP